jgi:tRNA U34 5-carboxymethylaminomethyl modifying enzyme MnmG/GidA
LLVNQQRYLSILIASSSDRCYLQKRVLNSSKGPAVRALRAQTDKREYAIEMKNSVERSVYTKLLTLLGFIILSGTSISG